MERIFMPNADREERLHELESQCNSIVEDTYYHKLTEEEIALKEKEATKFIIELRKIKDEKKETLKDFKSRIDPLEEELERLGLQVDLGHEERFDKLYKFVDGKKRMVYYYDSNGMLIETKTRPAEENDIVHQLRITGTND